MEKRASFDPLLRQGAAQPIAIFTRRQGDGGRSEYVATSPAFYGKR
jgi:hypothetical protein